MQTPEATYEISSELDPRHDQDVKCVLAIDDDRIASCSRDGSVGIWDRQDESFALKALLKGHNAYVNSLAHIPHSSSGPLIASGGNSSLILLHSLDTLHPDSVHCLIGHALNVCVLSYASSSRRLITGSWDQTARVWSEKEKEWTCDLVLEGHNQAVWGVVALEKGSRSGCFLTGSADQLVILWDEDGHAMSRFKGYPEPVRGLALMTDHETFVSGCNDGLIRISDLTGTVLGTLRGHKDSVYQVSTGPQDQILSCSEDHSARVWDDQGKEIAKLLHPCQTVWSVDMLPNGDVVTGGSDGRVRVWTKDESRMAGEDVREPYNDEVVTAMKASVPAQSEEPKDLVIDIDVSDDSEPLKLTIRSDQDPREVAEAFVAEHELPESYTERIEAFVQLHLGHPTIVQTDSSA